MSCETTKEMLEHFALGILDTKECDEVAAHVQSCASCSTRLASLKQATRMLNDAFDEEPPEWLSQKVMYSLKNAPKRSFPWRFNWGIPAVAGIAAVILALAIQPGIIQKSIIPSDALHSSHAIGRLAMKQKSGNTSYEATPAPANQMISGAAIDITDELNINLKNPIYDRSIYDNLGVKKEVAKLLL
jgi:hypothetical protein